MVGPKPSAYAGVPRTWRLSGEMSESWLSQVRHVTFQLRSIALHEPMSLNEVMPPIHRPRPVEVSRRCGGRSTMPCEDV